MKYKKKILFVVCILGVVLICSSAGYCIKSRSRKADDMPQMQTTTKEEERDFELRMEQLAQQENEKLQEEESIENEDEQNEKVRLPEPVLEEPVTQLPVLPEDIYVMNGSEGKINCYFKDADEYIWEYYDEKGKKWNYVSENSGIHLTEEMDELNRNISTLVIQGIKENDGLLVRCRVGFPEEEEQDYQASFHILSFKSEDIEQIEVLDAYNAEAGTYVSTLDIPVNITKTDGSQELITGLNDLFFCLPQGVTSDMEKANDGTTVETVTTTTIENKYYLVNVGESKVQLRYRGISPGEDTSFLIKGEDSQAPEVEVSLSEYGISNIDQDEEIIITAKIQGTDNYSALTKLLYAFKPKDEEIIEDDFGTDNKITVQIKGNGIWTAYVKDEAGNIGSRDIEIITVDQKAPVIKSVRLKHEEGWYQDNTIIVDADDKTTIQYSYSCSELGVDSGWIEKNEYKIDGNGIWKVKVRDIAGNEGNMDIEVVNIDNQAPIILNIKVKEIER